MSMMIAFASPLSYVYIPKLIRLTLQLLIVSSYNTFCTHFVDITGRRKYSESTYKGLLFH